MTSKPSSAPSVATPTAATAMHIGEVAARTELSLRSLRHWDEVGLVRPSGRSEGGFRLYTEHDVQRILLVRRMKPLGFTLEQMRNVLVDIEVLHDDTAPAAIVDEARARLIATRAEALERRAQLDRQVGMADEFLGLLAHEIR